MFKKTASTPLDEFVIAQRQAAVKAAEKAAEKAAVKAAAAATAEPVVAPVAATAEADVESVNAEASEAGAESAEAAPRKRFDERERRRQKKANGEEYAAFPLDQWQELKQYYALDDASILPSQLLTRSDESKSVTLVTEGISIALLARMKAQRLKVVYTGLKAFERNEVHTKDKVYRLCQAGLHMFLPHERNRTMRVSARDFQLLLERRGDLLSFDDFGAATQKEFEAASPGTLVCTLDRPNMTLVE